MNLITSYNRRF